ncbi:hypothetical protein UPYG_G00060550 [Umbra pygmaea]|uniref:Ig-like domain-containing protein n=1 Tax=Umbra pygmaea TaxID=75934 RepID=A0ABD0X9W0_UMBPY
MSSRTTGSVLVVFLWSVTVVPCTNGWTVLLTQSICGLKGSSVELKDTYTGDQKVTSTFWSINKDQPGRELIGNAVVDLSVTDIQLQINPTSVSEGERVTLLCRTTCQMDPIPEYIWYKYGKPVTRNGTNTMLILYPVTSEDAGNYSCAVKGRDDLRSPENTLNVIYGPKNTSVSVSPSGEIVEGSSVTLTCSSDANPPVDNYTWYKNNVTSPKASGQSYNITNITSEDSGEYVCEAKNLYGHLNSSNLFVHVHCKY